MNILFFPLIYGLNAWWIMLLIIIVMGYFFFVYAEQVKYTKPSLGTVAIMLWFVWIIVWILIYFFNMEGVL